MDSQQVPIGTIFQTLQSIQDYRITATEFQTIVSSIVQYMIWGLGLWMVGMMIKSTISETRYLPQTTGGNPDHKEWLEMIRRILVQRTGRTDIEVTGGPYRGYDVKVSVGADGHPIVDLYTPMRYDPARVRAALDYAVRMVEDWEATLAAWEKDMRIVRPHFERLKAMFPDLDMDYTVEYSERHFVQVSKEKGRIRAFFDLWPAMRDEDIQRIADYIKSLVLKVQKGASMAGVEYW